MVDWDERYRLGDTPWDKGAAHPALAETVRREPLSGRVLVPGCGLGYDLEAIAGCPNVSEVVGIDISVSAVRATTARLAHLKKAKVELDDLFALPANIWARYDWVWEHTCFCAIDPPQRNAYVNAVANVLRRGGHLLAVFYLRPWDTDEENRSAGPPFACPPDDLDRRFATRFEIVRIWDPPATYPGREGREQMRLLRRV